MVRLVLDDGPDLLVKAGIDEATRAFHKALHVNETLKVQTSHGLVAINPHRILYLEEEGSDSVPRRAAAAEAV